MAANAPPADLVKNYSSPPVMYVDAWAVTKSDTDNFIDAQDRVVPCNAIYVGGAGDMVVVKADGVTVTFVGIPAGSIIPIRAMRVNSTSTTASSMVALW